MDLPHPPLPSHNEIDALRAAERLMQASMEDADRLCRDLASVYACTFVVADDLPSGFWVRLPLDYREVERWEAPVRRGVPPTDLRGPVAINIETLRSMKGSA